MKSKSLRALDAAALLLALIYFIGTLTFLKPCAAHEDGSFMTCHWAGQALAGVGGLLALLACLKLAFRRAAVRQGLSLAMAPAALLAVFTPGTLIGLCMMDTMLCRAVMKPGATVFGLLIAALSLVEALLLARADKPAR